MIQAVFSDLDGVLRLWSGEQMSRTEATVGLPQGSFWAVAFDSELLRLAVTGRISDEEWRREAERRLRSRYPDADVGHAVRVWSAALGQVNTEVLELMRLCRRRVPVGLISNATSRLRQDLEQLHLTDEFDYIFNTSELGVAKPNPTVFQLALERVGVQAEHSFFVDDDADNIYAAAKLGMHAHLYEGVEPLRKALHVLGILSGSGSGPASGTGTSRMSVTSGPP